MGVSILDNKLDRPQIAGGESIATGSVASLGQATHTFSPSPEKGEFLVAAFGIVGCPPNQLIPPLDWQTRCISTRPNNDSLFICTKISDGDETGVSFGNLSAGTRDWYMGLLSVVGVQPNDPVSNSVAEFNNSNGTILSLDLGPANNIEHTNQFVVAATLTHEDNASSIAYSDMTIRDTSTKFSWAAATHPTVSPFTTTISWTTSNRLIAGMITLRRA